MTKPDKDTVMYSGYVHWKDEIKNDAEFSELRKKDQAEGDKK